MKVDSLKFQNMSLFSPIAQKLSKKRALKEALHYLVSGSVFRSGVDDLTEVLDRAKEIAGADLLH